MKVELWVGGHPKRVEPSDMDPMKGDPEGDEAKGRRLDQKSKPNETRTLIPSLRISRRGLYHKYIILISINYIGTPAYITSRVPGLG